MPIKSNFTVKLIEQTQVGELIRFGVKPGEAIIGIVLLVVEKKTHRVGILADVPKVVSAFHYFEALRERPCTSLGTDWIMSLEAGEETVAGNGELRNQLGAVHVGDSAQAVLRFNPANDGFDDEMFFDMRNLAQVDNLPKAAAPVASWKIWAQADEGIPGKAPLFARNA